MHPVFGLYTGRLPDQKKETAPQRRLFDYIHFSSFPPSMPDAVQQRPDLRR
jgi:hypothetical protein